MHGIKCGLSDKFKINEVNEISWNYSDGEPIGKVEKKADGKWTVIADREALNKIYEIPAPRFRSMSDWLANKLYKLALWLWRSKWR